MERMKSSPLLFSVVALALAAGCKPKSSAVTDLQRKEAAHLVSEAQFAITLRDFARAEPLFEKAAKLAPDTGDYWVNLGVARRRLGKVSEARAAYKHAREAFRDAYKSEPKRVDAMLQEVYALALLGQVQEAREALEKAQKKLPDNRSLREFAETKQLDRILSDPTFKEIALEK